MDFSSWQTWVILAVATLVVLGLIGYFAEKSEKAKKDAGAVPPKDFPTGLQATMLAATSATASGFDREMYIDDMTPEQLEDEHVWRAAFIACHHVTLPCGVSERHPANRIASAITGKPFDRQLFGLTEYYLETAYDDMMAKGEDRYWDDDLIAGKDQLSPEKREQVVLAALIPLMRARDVFVAVRKDEPGPDDTGAGLIPFIERTAQAFFGAEADNKMAALRAQATQLASALDI